MSQRELAQAVGLSPSAVGHAEAGTRDMTAGVLARIAAVAGFRLALVDGNGHEVAPMSSEAVRDEANRRFPAHLDTRYSDQGWWHGPHRYDRAQPWYTFDRRRDVRDRYRRRTGTPDNHLLPRAGDSPQQRADSRRREYWLRRAQERERAFLAGELKHVGEAFECTCPAACDALDDWSGRPVHAPECPCACDVG